MIQVPNVIISLESQDHKSSVHEKPIWYADMWKAIWGPLLDPEKGCVVTELPDFTPENLRYSTYENIDTIERETVAYFIGGSQDQKRSRDVVSIFKRLFPDGLRKLVEDLIKKDILRAKERLNAKKSSPIPHPSFISAGLTPTMALNLQLKGFANIGECASADVIELSGCGLSPVQVAEIMQIAQQSKAATEVVPASQGKAK